MSRTMTVLLICASRLCAAENQTQHALDTPLKVGAWDVTLHSRMRTIADGGGVAQVRFGPILKLSLNRKASLIGGYYFTREKGNRLWSTTHRPFAGVEARLLRRESFELEGRSVLERFLPAAQRDYFRWRNRLRWSANGTTAPYTSLEYLYDRHGFRSSRYSAGLSRKQGAFTVDVGYFFEHRRLSAGGNRHVFLTAFLWRNTRGPDL